MQFFRVIVTIGWLCFATSVQASPWVGTTDPQLHYDLQTLVDYGYLNNTATTYPTPWKGIIDQLRELSAQDMPKAAATALLRLRHYGMIFRSQRNLSSATIYGANERSRFASFDGQQGEKARLNTNSESIMGPFAAKLSVNLLPGGKTNLDQSYFAYQAGDWNIRIGAIDQWWGPGHSSSLVLSNNGRPIQSVALSRSSSGVSQDSWLDWLGPWYYTAQIGQLEDDSVVEDAKIWASRVAIRPISGLDMALSWVATWGGSTRTSDSFGEFFDVITLQKACPIDFPDCQASEESYVGNHLSAADIKYTFSIFEHPISVYGQYVYEGKSSEFNATNKARLYGLSTYAWGAKLYIERSDTNLACSEGVISLETCVYESGTYSSSARFYNQEIGSQYDVQADMLALGYLRHFSDGDVLEFAVRRIDGADAQPIDGESQLADKILQISGYYQTVWRNWQVKIGAVVDKLERQNADNDRDSAVFAELKYSF